MALLQLGVAQAETATTSQLSAAPNPSVAGQPVTFTANVVPVTSGSQTPTGTVTFFDGGNQIGTGNLIPNGNFSVAILTTGTLTVGSHITTTSYPGDGNFGGSNGGPVTQVVNKNNTTTLLQIQINPSSVNSDAVFAITISPVTGTVASVAPGAA